MNNVYHSYQMRSLLAVKVI